MKSMSMFLDVEISCSRRSNHFSWINSCIAQDHFYEKSSSSNFTTCNHDLLDNVFQDHHRDLCFSKEVSRTYASFLAFVMRSSLLMSRSNHESLSTLLQSNNSLLLALVFDWTSQSIYHVELQEYFSSFSLFVVFANAQSTTLQNLDFESIPLSRSHDYKVNQSSRFLRTRVQFVNIRLNSRNESYDSTFFEQLKILQRRLTIDEYIVRSRFL